MEMTKKLINRGEVENKFKDELLRLLDPFTSNEGRIIFNPNDPQPGSFVVELIKFASMNHEAGSSKPIDYDYFREFLISKLGVDAKKLYRPRIKWRTS